MDGAAHISVIDEWQLRQGGRKVLVCPHLAVGYSHEGAGEIQESWDRGVEGHFEWTLYDPGSQTHTDDSG